MIMNNKTKYLHWILGLALLASCSTNDEVISPTEDEAIIHVGGINTGYMVSSGVITRTSLDDKNLDWLKNGLAKGMDIFYYKDASDMRPGTLKLVETNSVITYSLTHNNEPCKWLGNGDHTFLGAYVTDTLKSESTANDYNAQCHYTAMPPSTKIAATIGTITIPLQHRLARVKAYVLIEESMGTGVKLKNYDKDNYNAANTMIRFCNVDVLKKVDSEGHPIWKNERKFIPHYLGEESVIVYKEKTTGKLVYPIDDDYPTASNSSSYECIDYGSVPCYDIIVRPTYTETTNSANVMPDELNDGTTNNLTDTNINQIDFELTLDNDLEYEKHFEFDLNANEETVVYLRVTPERIDYSSAGSRLWKSEQYDDAYYGVNNQNDNSLSKAGCTWQRAYTNATLDVGVTDGHYYNADEEDVNAQYVGNAKWIELLKQATKTDIETGACHGKYFILQNNITIDLNNFPTELVFTGHLDALDHTIIIEKDDDGRDYLFTGLESNWDAEILNTKVVGGTLFKDGTTINGHVRNCTDKNGSVENIPATLPTY